MAEDELFALLLPKLRALARYLLKGERKGHPLQSMDLVNEMYCKMLKAKDRDWQNRQHFFAIAARIMRRHLIDLGRRPHGKYVPIDGWEDLLPAESARLDSQITVYQLLGELAESHPDLCTVVEMRLYLQLNEKEIAEALGLGERTVQRRIRDARRWLYERLGSNNGQ